MAVSGSAKGPELVPRSGIVRRWYYYRDNNELVELSVLRHKRK